VQPLIEFCGDPMWCPGAEAGPEVMHGLADAFGVVLASDVVGGPSKLAGLIEVREKRLSANPLDGFGLDREWKAPIVDYAVDRRRVASPAQMRQLLDAIRSIGKSQGPRLVALFGCMYYGMLRPSEAVSLRLDECELPASGWGRLEFREVHSAAGREWTDDGQVHEAREPKGGPKNSVRRVPIPPELVRLLREHVESYGTAPDGRLFWTYRGGIYQPSTLWQVLRKARTAAFPPAVVASPLASLEAWHVCRNLAVSPAELGGWLLVHSAYIPELVTWGGFWWHMAAQPFSSARSVFPGQYGFGLVVMGAPSRIRTCAHGSGGRCSLP
jgi:hypothetical protein